jgi:PAS domain S-box-containing protein
LSLAHLPYAAPLFFAGGLTLFLAAIAWRRRARPEARGFILLMLAVSVWALPEGLLQISDTESLWMLWTKVEYLGIAGVPLAWWVTAFQYSRRARPLPKPVWFLMVAVPVVTVVLAWTQELHPLIYQEQQYFREGGVLRFDADYGVWFWVNVGYAYLLLLWGAVLFLTAAFYSFHIYRIQAIALLSAVVLPWVGNILYIFRIGPLQGLDLTPFTFAVAGIPMAWAILRLRLYDLAPVARNAVIEGMRDGMVVLDLEDRISDLNPAGSRILGASVRELLGQHAADIFGEWILSLELDDAGNHPPEISLPGEQGERFFEVDLFPLVDKRDLSAGRLMILRDITERRALGRELDTAREEIRMLSGLLPICAWCKQVRDDEGYWREIETFLADRSDAQFTHSICPSCLEGVDAKVGEGEEEDDDDQEEGSSREGD